MHYINPDPPRDAVRGPRLDRSRCSLPLDRHSYGVIVRGWLLRSVLDFEYHYTEQQQLFRADVQAWISTNIPEDLIDPAMAAGSHVDSAEAMATVRRRLGEKGWLAPTAPVEFGGAALTHDHALVLIEELGSRGLHWVLGSEASSVGSALQEWGTEEQKEQFLRPFRSGELNTWRISLESGADLDKDNLGIRAFLDGDDYVLSGSAVFWGSGTQPDYLWLVAVTDPDGPPSKSTAAFLVPALLNGVRIDTPDSLISGQSHRVTFDNVWVPSHFLLGEDGHGWSVMDQPLDAEEYANQSYSGDEEVADLIKYASENSRYGTVISKQPFFQQMLMEVYTNSEVIRVLKLRNVWMAETKQELTYQKAQTELLEKKAALRLSQVVREIMGVYALLGSEDPMAPMRGRFQIQQKRSLARQNPAGALEAQAAIVARHLGFDPYEGKNTEYAQQSIANW